MWQNEVRMDIHKVKNETAHDGDFGFYHPDDLPNIALCAMMLKNYGILPSQTMKEITENWELFADVLTYRRVWDDVPELDNEV